MKLSEEDVKVRLLIPMTLNASSDHRGQAFSKCILTIENNVDLRGCVFYKCHPRVDVEGVVNIDPIAADFDYSFHHKILDKLELDKLDFSKVDLSLAEIHDTTISKCTFINTEFARTNIFNSKIDKCKSKDMTFHNCTFENVVFEEVDIRDCTFYHCDFDFATEFSLSSNLKNVYFEDCYLDTEDLEVCSSCNIVHLSKEHAMNYTNWGEALCEDCGVQCDVCEECFTREDFDDHDCSEEDED